jgi:hypothetical protein
MNRETFKSESGRVRKWESEHNRSLPVPLSHFPTFPLSIAHA